MVEPGKFRPATEHELSATLDVTWHAIAEARKNMSVLQDGRDALEKRNEQLKKELEQAREKLKEVSALEQQLKKAAAKNAELQQTLDAEKARGDDLGKQFTEAANRVHAFQKQLGESKARSCALEEQAQGAVSKGDELQRALDAEKARSDDLQKQLSAAADSVQAVENQLSESQQRSHSIEEQLDKVGDKQKLLTDELSSAREAMARLVEENERLQRELAEMRDELAAKNAELANDGQLMSAALQIDLDALHRSIEQIDACLDDQTANSILTPAHQGKRVIWIGCKNCTDCTQFAAHDMEKLAVSGPDQALEILTGQGADALVTDISAAGIDWLSDVRKRWPDLAIIVTTGYADGRPETDAAIRRVATTVIPQSCGHDEVAAAVRVAFLRKAISSGTEALGAGCTPERPRLLLADDDEMIRKLLSTRLDQRGHDTVCVEDGAAAWEAVQSNEFDVVITDILMPHLGGIELTTKLKMFKPKLPVIVLSAAEDAASSLAALRAGAFCYVVKPADIDELALVIQRAMHADRLERELREQHVLLEKRTAELEKALQELQEAAALLTSQGRPRAERAGAPAGCSVAQ